jgi:hypothetical protein
MDNLHELEAIWQKHQPQFNESIELKLKDTGIFSKLKKLNKKHFRINLIKTILVAIILIFLSFAILSLKDTSIITKAGLGWIILSLFIGLTFYWKMQYNQSNLEFIDTSDLFIEKTIIKLSQQKKIITHLMPIMVSGLILGLNLIYYDLLKGEELTVRISLHILMSSFLVLIMFLGLTIRKKRFKNDFQPIIDELETIKQNFKNNN